MMKDLRDSIIVDVKDIMNENIWMNGADGAIM